MSNVTAVTSAADKAVKKGLPVIDIDAEIKKFEAEERKRLGLDDKTDHWIEDMAGLTFTMKEKAKITLLVGGLTVAHDFFVEAGIRGNGYNVQMLECPTNEGLQVGKEFGNRGPVQPDVLHRRQPREVPHHAARQARDERRGDRQELRASSPRARAARAASACTSPSTGRRSATPASTASASSSSSRRAA